MLFGITGQHRNRLARGVAVLAIGGLAAGCSSGVGALTDGLTTGSTGTTAVARSAQPYPGNAVPRPKEAVGGVVQNHAVTWPQAGTPTSSQPVYNTPPVQQSSVSSSPLPPPSVEPSAQSFPPAPSDAASRQNEQQPTEVAALPQAPSAPASLSSGSGSVSGGSYTVASGDTLYSISRRSGVSVDRIKEANGLDDGMIRTGQTLTIPGGAVVAAAANSANTPEPVKTAAASNSSESSSRTVAEPRREPETVPQMPEASSTPPSQPKQADVAAPESSSETEVAALTPQSTGVDRLRWPVRGRVISGFGSREGGRVNDGITIAVPEGTAVHAAENGVVIYAGDGLKGFGKTVLVRHEDGLVTVYGHTSQMKVKRGDKVSRGQEIALSGMTGDADRPMLHFEVRKGTSPVDPSTYLD